MRGILRVVLLLLACVSLFSCHKSTDDSGIGGSVAIAESVATMPCFFSSNIEKDLEAVEGRLDLVKRDDSRKAEEALVMLMGYYLGEHNHEELMVEIVRRGKRMKPLLTKEMEKPASISTCAPSMEKRIVGEQAGSLISAIDKGERWE